MAPGKRSLIGDTSTLKGSGKRGCFLVALLWFGGLAAAVVAGIVLIATQGTRPAVYRGTARSRPVTSPEPRATADLANRSPRGAGRGTQGAVATSSATSTTATTTISTQASTSTAGTGHTPGSSTNSSTHTTTATRHTNATATATHRSTDASSRSGGASGAALPRRDTSANASQGGATNSAPPSRGRPQPGASPRDGTRPTAPAIVVPHGAPPRTLVKKDLVTGTGVAAHPHDTITVRYVGALYGSGKIFYSSWQTRRTYSSRLDVTPLIKGWNEGVAGMRVGGRRELIVPPGLGYGSQANGRTIPARIRRSSSSSTC